MEKIITTADLSKVRDTLVKGMIQNFKNDGEIFPTAIIIDPKGKMTIIGTPYTNQNEKNQMMGAVESQCKKVDAIALFLISEAWVRAIKTEDYAKTLKEMEDKGKRVSDYDDKKEVAILIFETKLTTETITFEIDRENNELINKISARTAGGNFANILSPVIQNN